MEVLAQKLAEFRNAIVSYSELRFREERTRDAVADCLREHGLEAHEVFGVFRVLRAGTGRPAFAPTWMRCQLLHFADKGVKDALLPISARSWAQLFSN